MSLTLDRLKTGEEAVIVQLTCSGINRRRLLDLGLLPGTRLQAEMKSPLGDPVAYRVREALIALRREQAKEIVIPTILMLTLTLGNNIAGAQAGVMLELDSPEIYTVLTQVGGWTMLTAVNLMLFSLLHNPCSTTILTIWNETKNLKWTVMATIMPIVIGVIVLLTTTTIAHLLT